VKYCRGFFALMVLFLASLACLPACSPERPQSREVVTIDLIPLRVTARMCGETGMIDIRGFDRYYYLADGWSHPFENMEEGEVWTGAVVKECVLRYSVVRPADRWLSFRIRLQGPIGDLKSQNIAVYAIDSLLSETAVSGGAVQDAEFYIPSRLQVVGDNELILRFEEYAENPHYLESDEKHRENPYPGVAAYFTDLAIVLGDESEVWPGQLQGQFAAFAPVAEGKELIQKANSSISYAFDLKVGSSLVLSGALKAPPKSSGIVSVSVESRTDENPAWAKLWKEETDLDGKRIDSPFQALVGLDDVAGQPVELRITLVTTGRPADVRVRWDQIALEIPKPESMIEADRPAARADNRIKHVVYIVLDAARPDYLGCYGSGEGLTPNLDELAKSSLVFENAVAPAAYTLASSASLFSGLLPETHGVSFGVNHTYAPYPEELESLPKAFKRSGFYTLMLSGNFFTLEEFGLAQGCDVAINIRTAETEKNNLATMDFARMEKGLKVAVESGKRVFMYVHFLPPHWPYNPPKQFGTHVIDREPLSNMDEVRVNSLLGYGLASVDGPEMAAFKECYKENLLYADFLVAEFMRMLREHDLLENSLIIISSDHGEGFGEHGTVGHNYAVYDEITKVPLIVHGPGIKPGRVSRQVGLIDIFPTVIELFDLQAESVPFEGRSIAPLMTGAEQEPGDYYFSMGSGHKLVFTLRGERYKYAYHLYREELFDLLSDPGEKVNIIDKHPALAADLRQRGMAIIYGGGGPARERRIELRLDAKQEERLRNLGYLQ
jgi:arylsulfatase A-like enzyme